MCEEPGWGGGLCSGSPWAAMEVSARLSSHQALRVLFELIQVVDKIPSLAIGGLRLKREYKQVNKIRSKTGPSQSESEN